jgi:hypothetical protein
MSGPFHSPQIPELNSVGAASSSSNDYLSRVSEYIPGEVLVPYVAMMGIIMSMSDGDALKTIFAWSAFALGMICTPLYLCFFKANRKPKILHLTLSCVAFALWSYALGGPFAISKLYRADVGSLLLIAFTLVSGRSRR